MNVKPARIQSPSSINIYKQCPRKYYYQYIAKIPTKTNIHLIRGSIAHKVLEDFYTIQLSEDESFLGDKLIKWINELFESEWTKNKIQLESLNLGDNLLKFYYEETKGMLNNWAYLFLSKLSKIHANNVGEITPAQAFQKVVPRIEELYQSENFGVKGYIDVIEEFDENIRLMDYKTSGKAHITPEYKLQLAIYSLLYNEKHGVMPSKVGIVFLKFGEEHEITVTKELLDFAELEIELIHMNTQFNEITDYQRKESPLCKWSTGQCDFYDICLGSNRTD